MRVARHFIAVVGIASATHFAAPPTLAWGPFSSAKNANRGQQANDDMIVDQSVQQAGWQTMQQQRPATATRPNAMPSANRGARASAAPNSKKGALFHGYQMRMPELPFARTNSNKQQSGIQKRPQPNTNVGLLDLARDARQPSPRPIMPQQASPSQFHANVGTQMQTAGRNQGRVTVGNQLHTGVANQQARQPMAARSIHAAPQVAVRPPAPITAPRALKASPPIAQATPSINPMSVKAAPPISQAAHSINNGAAEKLIAQAHQLSTSAQSEADFSQVIETCRRAKQSGSNQIVAKFADDLSSWSLNRRGQIKAEAGRDKEAIADFAEAIRTNPQCWRALHNRGVLLAQAGQFEKAFDDFNRTIEFNPEFAKAYSNRAALFMVADNLASASEDYKRAIELEASLQVAHRGYARVCHLNGRLEEAANHYDIAVELAPNDAFAVACRADLLADMGRYAESAAGYERAIALEPKSAQALGGSAWLLATCPDNSVRKPALAVGRATLALEVNANKDAADFDTLAAAQASAGDFQAAVESIHMALELAPAAEREIYQDRLAIYQQNKPFRIAPVRQNVAQARYDQ